MEIVQFPNVLDSVQPVETTEHLIRVIVCVAYGQERQLDLSEDTPADQEMEEAHEVFILVFPATVVQMKIKDGWDITVPLL